MKFALCGVLCIIQFVVFAGAESSKSKSKGIPRVIGGNSVWIQSYPYQVSMRFDVGYGQPQHVCGGTILSDRHILTAAHCTKPFLDEMHNIKIFTGTSRSDTGGQSHSVSSIVIHPEYVGEPDYFNDIAVITLSKQIVFSSTQRPIGLPTRNIANGAAATITGWGRTSAPDPTTPIYLQQSPMTLLDLQNCQSILSWQPLRNTQVCAIGRPGTGMCRGDSGGPLVSNGRVVGVASYVMKCGQSFPDVYTNVYSFLDFIEEIVYSETSGNNGQWPKNGHGQRPGNGKWPGHGGNRRPYNG